MYLTKGRFNPGNFFELKYFGLGDGKKQLKKSKAIISMKVT